MNNLDILLVNTPSANPGMIYAFEKQGIPPLGLGYLATFLKQANYSVKILDLCMPYKTIDTLIDILNNNNVRVIGFSCTTETYNVAVQLANAVKEKNPDYIVVVGGPHVSFEYESALNSNVIDYVVLNEGEISLKELCDYYLLGIGTLESLKGIAYKKNGILVCADSQPFITDLDILPFPDRELFEDISAYPMPATIITSRGCPGKCIFCSSSVLSGGRYRMRSVENVVMEFEYLKSLGYDNIVILDDTMTVSKARLEVLCNELVSKNLQISWHCESRVDAVDKDILVKMKTAGLTSIQFGVESGSQNVLDSMHKNISLKQIRNVFEWCRDIGIRANTNMIIGLPSSDFQSIEDTIMLADEIISLGGAVSWSVCTPFPGTSLWKNPDDFGIEIVDSDLDHYDLYRPILNTKYMSAIDIRNAFYAAKKSTDIKMAAKEAEDKAAGASN